eukprot:369821_1
MPTEHIRIDRDTDVAIHTDEKHQDRIMFFVENPNDGEKFLFTTGSTDERDEWIRGLTNVNHTLKEPAIPNGVDIDSVYDGSRHPIIEEREEREPDHPKDVDPSHSNKLITGEIAKANPPQQLIQTSAPIKEDIVIDQAPEMDANDTDTKEPILPNDNDKAKKAERAEVDPTPTSDDTNANEPPKDITQLESSAVSAPKDEQSEKQIAPTTEDKSVPMERQSAIIEKEANPGPELDANDTDIKEEIEPKLPNQGPELDAIDTDIKELDANDPEPELDAKSIVNKEQMMDEEDQKEDEIEYEEIEEVQQVQKGIAPPTTSAAVPDSDDDDDDDVKTHPQAIKADPLPTQSLLNLV